MVDSRLMEIYITSQVDESRGFHLHMHASGPRLQAPVDGLIRVRVVDVIVAGGPANKAFLTPEMRSCWKLSMLSN